MRLAFAALTALAACGGTSLPTIPLDSPSPLVSGLTALPTDMQVLQVNHQQVIYQRQPGVMVVLGTGQSNMSRGNEEGGIGQQFTRRLQADNPGTYVVYVQSALGGRNVAAFAPDGEVYRLTQETYTGLPTADFLLVHQGESDHHRLGADFVADWNAVLDQFDADGITDDQTITVFGEIPPTGPYASQNAVMGGINHEGVASAAGASLMPDGYHLDAAGRNTMGDRYYDVATK